MRERFPGFFPSRIRPRTVDRPSRCGVRSMASILFRMFYEERELKKTFSSGGADAFGLGSHEVPNAILCVPCLLHGEGGDGGRGSVIAGDTDLARRACSETRDTDSSKTKRRGARDSILTVSRRLATIQCRGIPPKQTNKQTKNSAGKGSERSSWRFSTPP